MTFIARARAFAALLAAAPRLGLTITDETDVVSAIEARINATPVAAAPVVPAAPTAEQIEAGTLTLLAANGIPVAAGQAAAQAIAAFAANMDGLDAQLTAANARADLIMNALATAGIKPVASDAKAGLTAADITTALDARISTRASEQLSTHGTPIVASAPATDNTKPTAKAPVAGRELETVAAVYKTRMAGRGL